MPQFSGNQEQTDNLICLLGMVTQLPISQNGKQFLTSV